MFTLKFLIPWLMISWFMSNLGFDFGVILIHPTDKAESLQGALKTTERYGGQIIEEIEKDYPSTIIGTIRLLKEQSSR